MSMSFVAFASLIAAAFFTLFSRLLLWLRHSKSKLTFGFIIAFAWFYFDFKYLLPICTSIAKNSFLEIDLICDIIRWAVIIVYKIYTALMFTIPVSVEPMMVVFIFYAVLKYFSLHICDSIEYNPYSSGLYVEIKGNDEEFICSDVSLCFVNRLYLINCAFSC